MLRSISTLFLDTKPEEFEAPQETSLILLFMQAMLSLLVSLYILKGTFAIKNYQRATNSYSLYTNPANNNSMGMTQG
jgi:hypothetical protein